MRIAMLALVAGLAAAPASAQTPREAISSGLSPEAAAVMFRDAVMSACVPAVAGSGVGGLPQAVRGKLQASTDPEMRRQIGATAEETVWDVIAGKGVVSIHAKPGRCVVSVYGPPAMATVMSIAAALVDGPGFERLAAAPPPNGFGQSLLRVENGKRIMVTVNGSEPGMPGNKSRFSVITATVFGTPAG